MNHDTRKNEVFSAIRALVEIVPEMRAGQLVAVLGERCSDIHGRGLWDASDDELLEAVCRFRRDLESAGIIDVEVELP